MPQVGLIFLRASYQKHGLRSADADDQLFIDETLQGCEQRLQLTCCAEAGGDLGETVTGYLGGGTEGGGEISK